MKVSVYLVLLLMIMILNPGCPSTPPDENRSQEIARSFMVNEATFKYDGMPETLKLTATSKSPDGWEFVYQFTSRNAGYGNRAGQIVLPVLTDHIAKIKVVNDKVTSAVMDDRWDMLKQAMVK